MAKKEFKRPDEAAMLRVLETNEGTAAELILRLVWTAGLNATELHELRWSDIALGEARIDLSDRGVPMDEALVRCLRKRREKPSSRQCEYVITTDARRTHMHRVHISKTAGEALNAEEALQGITLKDLREDYIIRLLERHDWPYVSRVSGTAISTLYANYRQYMKPAQPEKAEKPEVDDFALWRVMQAEGASPVGLALWMSREMGIALKDIVALTWEQVDFAEKVLRLPGGTVQMGVRLERQLRQVKETREPDADPHVLLSPKARRPYDARRLGQLVRQALINGGIEAVTGGSLITERQQKKTDEPILQLLERRGGVSRNAAAKALDMEEMQVWRCLNRLVEQGKVVRVGGKYFKAGTVVSPAEQYAVIRGYLEQRGSASRQELAAQLNIELRPCGWILSGLVAEGKLIREGRRYRLGEKG